MKMVDQFVQQLQMSVETMNKGLEQMVQAQQQQMEALGQIGKIMSAPKKIITDDKGEPVGVEPVL
jgi:flagellar hook assembly protein FlgD